MSEDKDRFQKYLDFMNEYGKQIESGEFDKSSDYLKEKTDEELRKLCQTMFDMYNAKYEFCHELYKRIISKDITFDFGNHKIIDIDNLDCDKEYDDWILCNFIESLTEMVGLVKEDPLYMLGDGKPNNKNPNLGHYLGLKNVGQCYHCGMDYFYIFQKDGVITFYNDVNNRSLLDYDLDKSECEYGGEFKEFSVEIDIP
jgi:hypothetical protein